MEQKVEKQKLEIWESMATQLLDKSHQENSQKYGH